jgi:hypothetical protein
LAQDYAYEDDTGANDGANNGDESQWLQRTLRSTNQPSNNNANGPSYYTAYSVQGGNSNNNENSENSAISPRFRYVSQKKNKFQNSYESSGSGSNQPRFIEDLSDYDIVGANEEDNVQEQEERTSSRYRGGHKGGKGGKKGGKRGGEEEEDDVKKYVPQFWLGKPKPGWGHSHVQQVGYILNKDLGGWSVWPAGWTSSTGVDTGGLKYVDGQGWVGTVGAPWTMKDHSVGPGYGWRPRDEGGGELHAFV